jgi:hypothetical protein
MKRLTWTLLIAAVVAASMALQAQQAAPDLILSNGKIITVDETFSLAQAVAVRGDRIVAVGTNQDINRLAGPNTRRIDLRGAGSPDCDEGAGVSLLARRAASVQKEVGFELLNTVRRERNCSYQALVNRAFIIRFGVKSPPPPR